jgi:hypothetical protein
MGNHSTIIEIIVHRREGITHKIERNTNQFFPIDIFSQAILVHILKS